MRAALVPVRAAHAIAPRCGALLAAAADLGGAAVGVVAAARAGERLHRHRRRAVHDELHPRRQLDLHAGAEYARLVIAMHACGATFRLRRTRRGDV